MGLVIGIFLLISLIVIIVNLVSGADDGITFLRRYIIYQGFIKKYGEVFTELGVTVKPYDHEFWEKSVYDDYRIEILCANKKERRSRRFKVYVDSQGNLSDEDEEAELLEIIKNKI